MNIKSSLLLPLIILMTIASSAQELEPPTLESSPSTPRQQQLIEEGIALHDRGEYDAAIEKYDLVLAENPNNTTALYELAASYSEKKAYSKALELAYRGARYKSNDLGLFYMLIGNNLDLLGQGEKAVDVYHQGLEILPGNSRLYYNLGVTYSGLKKSEEAATSFTNAIRSNPNHPGSHLALSTNWENASRNTPAFLALLRFLILEPHTSRSTSAYGRLARFLRVGTREYIDGVLRQQGITRENVVTIDPSDSTSDNFMMVDLMMGTSRTMVTTEIDKDTPEIQRIARQLDIIINAVSMLKPPEGNDKFVWQYYVAYFTDMKKNDLVEPFAYYISQKSGLPGVLEWMGANEERVNAFLKWTQRYRWPKFEGQ